MADLWLTTALSAPRMGEGRGLFFIRIIRIG